MSWIINKIYSIYFYSVLFFINTFFSGTHFFTLKNYLFDSIGIKVGKGTKVVGPIRIGKMIKLEMGKNCWIGKNFIIHGNGNVKIGDNCDLGPDVTILTGSHEIGYRHRRAGKGITYNYYIGDGVWIGSKSTIINGANIADGVVIGACSLVNKDCKCDSVYFGHPAKIHKSIERLQ